MYWGDNARTINKLYYFRHGNTKGLTAYKRDVLLPLCNEYNEVTDEVAFKLAQEMCPKMVKDNKINNWQDLKEYLLQRYLYSSTMLAQVKPSVEPMRIGRYIHGEDFTKKAYDANK